jgi:hypothetical protein
MTIFWLDGPRINLEHERGTTSIDVDQAKVLALPDLIGNNLNANRYHLYCMNVIGRHAA